MSFKVASVFALFVAMASASGGVSSFAYGVSDPYTGDIKNQQESRVGDNVVGQYSLVESDGTKRVVDYAANAHSGFNAVVRKEPLYGHAAPVLAAAPLAPVAPLAYGAHASPLAYGAGSLAYGARAVSPLAYGAGSLAYGAQAVAPLAYAARAISPVAVSSYSSQLAHGGYAAPLAYGGYGASALGAYGASPLSLGHGSLGYSRLGW